MSEFLAVDRALPGEAPTVEGRLADIMAAPDCVVQVSEYKLSDADRHRVVNALRGAEARPVVDLLRAHLKLTPRQRWYLAESIANSIGHELVPSTDDLFAEELAEYNACLLPGEAELDAWVKSLPGK